MVLALIFAVLWATLMTYLWVKARGDYFDLEMKLRESERTVEDFKRAFNRK